MQDGYVKLWRKSLKSDVWDNPNVWRLWCWLLMKASYQSCKLTVGLTLVELAPGELVFGRKKCSIETGLSEKKVRNCLQALKTASRIAIKTASKFSIVSIINWGDYQVEITTKGQLNGQQKGQQGASKGPAKGHKQEGKEVKNVKNKETTLCEHPEFEQFWQVYPRRIGKADAVKAWFQQNGSRPDISVIIGKVENLKRSRQWTTDGGRYIPHPATWLRRHGWDDEPETKTATPGWGDQDENDSRV